MTPTMTEERARRLAEAELDLGEAEKYIRNATNRLGREPGGSSVGTVLALRATLQTLREAYHEYLATFEEASHYLDGLPEEDPFATTPPAGGV